MVQQKQHCHQGSPAGEGKARPFAATAHPLLQPTRTELWLQRHTSGPHAKHACKCSSTHLQALAHTHAPQQASACSCTHQKFQRHCKWAARRCPWRSSPWKRLKKTVKVCGCRHDPGRCAAAGMTQEAPKSTQAKRTGSPAYSNPPRELLHLMLSTSHQKGCP